MRKSCLTMLLIGSTFAFSSAQGAELKINLMPVQAAEGQILMSLHQSTDSWDGAVPPVNGLRQDAVVNDQGGMQMQFRDLAPGQYAILVTHDRNSNGKMDSNITGMPIEPYGFSNNPRVMRKATFEEARFEVPADGTEITVHLR